ncbi:MAG: DNA replication/repair protein RecF [Clostridia bacterium]|nr:DNA replication/repair protein RecF [Clostridia bacterium]
MQAKKLILKSFRNYEEEVIGFCPDVNIIHGDNAQGKTNILEAVYLFSMGKSNRAKRDAELIRHGDEMATLALDFSNSQRDFQGEMSIFRTRRKNITINELPVRKNSELVGKFRVVYFGPEYLSLVKEGPKQRRKNIDILISQLRPNYFSALSDLKKLIESKNALLKMDKPNIAMLDILNEKMSGLSADIIKYRQEYIEKIGSLSAELQREISGGKEELKINYISCVGEIEGLSSSELKEKLVKKLEESKQREIDYRESIIGPHREDIEYYINDKEAKLFASQGQQKTIVLSQKLAEVQLMNHETGEMPVLLLDDIMSELDKKRQGFILKNIGRMQIIITCTDIDGFDIDNKTKLFFVENGKIKG